MGYAHEDRNSRAEVGTGGMATPARGFRRTLAGPEPGRLDALTVGFSRAVLEHSVESSRNWLDRLPPLVHPACAWRALETLPQRERRGAYAWTTRPVAHQKCVGAANG